MISAGGDPRNDGALAQRLLSPATRLPLAALGQAWFHQVVVCRIDRPRRHDEPLTLLNRIRGAWGESLKRGASAAAIGGRPCDFDPPSSFDVFFREQARIGGRHGLPKPYVFVLDVRRNELEIRLSVFGFACDWIAVARERLVEAVAHVRWTSDGYGEPVRVRSCALLTAPAMAISAAPGEVVLDFLTPFDATGEDVAQQPWSVVARLARRVDGLARWMDVGVEADWQEIAGHWRGLDFAWDAFERGEHLRGSRRQQRVFANPVGQASLRIAGDLAPVWPVLFLGQTCHVGRGAVAGQGRYRLVEPFAVG